MAITVMPRVGPTPPRAGYCTPYMVDRRMTDGPFFRARELGSKRYMYLTKLTPRAQPSATLPVLHTARHGPTCKCDGGEDP